MMYRALLFALFFAVVSAGAAPPLPLAQKNTTHIPVDAVITLHRGGLTIFIVADGNVMVEGQTFDYDIAAIRVRISRDEVQSLIDEFVRIGFFSLVDRYRDEADGCPPISRTHCVEIFQTTALTLNGQFKSIRRYPYECTESDGTPYPRNLVALEQQIEAVINLHRR